MGSTFTSGWTTGDESRRRGVESAATGLVGGECLTYDPTSAAGAPAKDARCRGHILSLCSTRAFLLARMNERETRFSVRNRIGRG